MPTYAAFGAFGVFWGSWGGALPGLRSQAGLTDGQLGTALLFVGVGALPAMMLTGWLLERWGPRLGALLLAMLGGTGVVTAFSARDMASVIACLLLVGATSGASDVAINTLGGYAEQHSGKPVLTRAHGVFSLAVVASSLGVGAAMSTDMGRVGVFVLVACAVTALAGVAGRATMPGWSGSAASSEGSVPPSPPEGGVAGPWPAQALPLIAVGLVGSLAYATENAHQSWSAVLVTDWFSASPPLAALAPAIFAGTAALTRLAVAPLSRSRPLPLLIAGGAVATVGSVVVAGAPTVLIALLGLAIAALGTSTLFPTLLSHTLRDTRAIQRPRATSTIATTAYLGYLVGPAYVGLVADAFGLRAAILAVALAALSFTAVVGPVGRWARRRI